ncbi:hypothetical protein [Neotabrizicola sp. VNH66]
MRLPRWPAGFPFAVVLIRLAFGTDRGTGAFMGAAALRIVVKT